MAKASDLTGLGLPPALSRILAMEPVVASAAGGSRASATAIGGAQHLTTFVLGTGSGGCLLPTAGGDGGGNLGDPYVINNQIAGGLYIYAATGTTISMNASNASGSSGINISSNTTAILWPITTTTWIGVVGG
jgi:hypothetical protein